MGDAPAAWHFVSFFSLKPEAQAAWVQAIGSLIALMIAVAIPASQAISNARKSRLRAKSLATVIMVELRSIREAFDKFLEQSDLSEDNLTNSGVITMLTLPDGIAEARPNLHEMDMAAEPLIALVTMMQMTHTALSSWKYQMAIPPIAQTDKVDPETVRQGLRDIPDLAANAMNAIGKLLGHV